MKNIPAPPTFLERVTNHAHGSSSPPTCNKHDLNEREEWEKQRKKKERTREKEIEKNNKKEWKKITRMKNVRRT
jgi:hypothetical protein